MLYDEIKHSHLGFYVYDNRAFNTREAVLDEMADRGDYNGNFQFYYNDHVYGNINWEKTLSIGIGDLYRIRAQQLRDKYKYLIVLFSGGSDSTQILQSFLKNDIFIDEIQVYNHEKAIKKLNRDDMVNNYHLSQFLEYEYAAEPMLKVVRELSPNTKINVIDITDFLYEQAVTTPLKTMGGDDGPGNARMAIPQTFRTVNHYFITYNIKNTSRDNVGVVRGFEKPVVNIANDGKIFCSFYDITMSGSINFQLLNSNPSYTLEDFYWSPDLPFIPVKQAQLIISSLSRNKDVYLAYNKIRDEIDAYRRNVYTASMSPSFKLERFYSKLIYPDWNPNTFVAPKATLSPEIYLLNTLGIEHNVDKMFGELKQHKINKYEKFTKKEMISKFIFSRLYYMGQFVPKFLI
jgi:hypothetical protein